MRIVSLVPHATELLYALGLGDSVVGVTHECDYPPETADVPKITRDVLPAGLSAGEIDAAVRERTEKGEAIYLLDEDRLAELEPDLIVTQELCPVCAVSYDEVQQVARRLDPCPTVIALDPKTFGETMGDIRTLAQATQTREAALDLVARQRSRAGGIDLLGFAGEHSEQLPWEAIEAAGPEVVLCIPCGYDGPRALAEAEQFTDNLRAIGAQETIALDAAAYFSRPGPRLVDGLETLAHALHPDRVPEAPGRVHRVML
jgi:iron complex transport system substrate-binding protein